MGILEIRLFGGFQLRVDGAPIDPIPSRKARSLLAFLVMNRDRTHTRDLLAGTFWPDLPDPEARRRLSRALWHIRARIDRDTAERRITTAGDMVFISSRARIQLDVEQFRNLLDESRLASVSDSGEERHLLALAVSLYDGDLLEGFYEDWALASREELRQDFLRASRRLCDLTTATGDYQAALAHARLLTRHDPWGEDGHRRVMRLAVLLGRHTDAIRQYELCRDILRQELDTEPSRTTQELLEAARQERQLTRNNLPATARVDIGDDTDPFVGRVSERSALLKCLEAALSGSGGVVLMEGDTGVGKTRLLEEMSDDARWRGFRILSGQAPESSGRPYACLTQALATVAPSGTREIEQQLLPVWLRQLNRLLPGLLHDTGASTTAEASLKPCEERVRVMEAVALALAALESASPLLILLDDLHWADADTVEVLKYLAQRLETRRILMVLSYRCNEARGRPELWEFVRSIDQSSSCSRLTLEGLSLGQTTELVRAYLHLPDVEASFARRVFEDTGGLPLLVIELLRQEELQARAGSEPGEASRVSGDQAEDLGPRLHEIMSRRLRDLHEHERTVLALLAVHGNDLTMPELFVASALPDATVLQAIDVLARRGLVMSRAGSLRVANGLLRRAAYGDLPAPTRADFHARLGRAIQTRHPQEVELLAHHFQAARLPDQAAHYLEQSAARAIAVCAYDTAAAHLIQAAAALDEAGATPDRRFRVAALREGVLDVLARRAEQRTALADMERYTSREDATEVMRRRSWWLANQDRFAEAEAEARKALELASSDGDSSRVVAILSTLGMIACVAGRAAEGVVYLERAAAHRGVGPRQQADARNALGQNLLDLQRFDEAEPQLLAALALYGELGDPRGEAEVWGMLGTLRMERGEYGLAQAALNRALDLSRVIGYRQGEAVYQMNLGILHALSSRPSLAFERFREAAITYERIGNQRGRALVLSNSAWLRHATLGEDRGAEDDARLALSAYQRIGDKRGQAQCLGTLGSVDFRRNAITEGTNVFKEALRLAREAHDNWIEAQILREWARSCLEIGQTEEGLAHVEEALQLCRRLGMRDLVSSLSALRGCLLIAVDRFDEALADTTTALASLEPGASVPQSVAFAHSCALAASGRGEEADYYLNLAHEQVIEAVGDLPAESRRSALDAVPAHRAIVEAWSARQPRQERHILARDDAPLGRPLTPDELRSVLWTIDGPDDQRIQGVQRRRQHRLLRLLEEARTQGGSPTVDQLAVALGTSVATARRDLSALRRDGFDVRTRGSRS